MIIFTSMGEHKILNELFITKYRPQTFDEFVDNDDQMIKKLENIILTDPYKMPNIILESPSPGTGKTSFPLLVIKLLNADSLKLNASKERGIDIIRTEVTRFVSNMGKNNTVPKIILMDEADGLTPQAQESLNNIIENTRICRFIFTCNDISKISDPIKSRCLIIHLGNPDKTRIKERLHYIIERENITGITEERLDNLIEADYPDIRSMVKSLESYTLFGEFDFETINSIGLNVYNAIKRKNKKELLELSANKMLKHSAIMYNIYEHIKHDKTIQDDIKLEYIEHICQGNLDMVNGVMPEIAFVNMVSKMSRV